MKSLQLQKPHFLVTVGLPGAGKSFFASQFSETFSAPYLDYNYYRATAGNEKVAVELASHTFNQLLRTNQTIVLEGIGSIKDERQELATVAKKHGYGILYIWVQTEPQTSMRRLANSTTGHMSNEAFVEAAEKFDIFQRGENFVVISGRHTYATQAKAVLRRLVSDRPTTTRTIQQSVPNRGRIIG
ncbi:MAG: AAA family ATPase [Candidatus Saccharimonadales bacterium]